MPDAWVKVLPMNDLAFELPTSTGQQGHLIENDLVILSSSTQDITRWPSLL